MIYTESMSDIVTLILWNVLGPVNFYRGIECLKTLYNAPVLAELLNAISTSERLGVAVGIKSDTLQNGLEELRRILDQIVENHQNLTADQKDKCKCANVCFVSMCHEYIISKSRFQDDYR